MGEKKDHASDDESTSPRKRFENNILRHNLRTKIKALQHETTHHIESEITEAFSKLLTELDESSKKLSKSSTPQEKSLRQKHFVARDSILTELFEVTHIRSIYHAFISVLVISIINSALRDFSEDGSVRLGLRTIVAGFAKIHIAFYIWLGMFCAMIVIYCGIWVWNEGRRKVGKSLERYWDLTFLALLILAYMMMFCIPAGMVAKISFPIGSGFAILMEQIRIIMKLHAFVRGCVPRYYVPSLSHFIYFLFIPTLVYRDFYPRTNHVRWNFAIACLLEVVGSFFLVCFIGEQYLTPYFIDFGVKKTNWQTLFIIISGSILPLTALLVSGFYLLLHAWMNGWAEVLRFADRHFYLDWWNSTSYMGFYRTWNIVVHDFLYEYIYADIRHVFTPSLGNVVARNLGTFSVFFISAFVHEYIIGFALGFFYPVLFAQFLTFGLIFAVLKLQRVGPIGNIFVWWSLTTGFAIQVCLYCMEGMARVNCPDAARDGMIDYFIPRSWTCNGLT